MNKTQRWGGVNSVNYNFKKVIRINFPKDLEKFTLKTTSEHS